MAGGWAFDDDATVEGDNALRQSRRLDELITKFVDAPQLRVGARTIRELNSIAVAGIVPRAGKYRTRDLQIVGSRHEPPPFQSVPTHMRALCRKLRGKPSAELAGYALWRINWIHPFEDGNGRVARDVAYLILCQWLQMRMPGTPTIQERILQNKAAYYACLEAADRASMANAEADAYDVTDFLNDRLIDQLTAAVALGGWLDRA